MEQKLMLVLDKVGTVIVDRRFWVSFFVLVMTLLGYPEVDEVDGLSDQAVGIAETVKTFVGIYANLGMLVLSWARRAPSGLTFKELYSELAHNLRELGVD